MSAGTVRQVCQPPVEATAKLPTGAAVGLPSRTCTRPLTPAAAPDATRALKRVAPVVPNATAAAMEPHKRQAGVASSLIGGLQTTLGAVAGYLIGVFYDHTPRSLALTVTAAAVLALLAQLGARVSYLTAEDSLDRSMAPLPAEV